MIKYCEWCDNQFSTDAKNQIYCSVECRESATKEKIISRYKVIKRKSRKNKERKCAGGCGSYLSIYNDSIFCSVCFISQKKLDKTLKEIKGLSNEDI